METFRRRGTCTSLVTQQFKFDPLPLHSDAVQMLKWADRRLHHIFYSPNQNSHLAEKPVSSSAAVCVRRAPRVPTKQSSVRLSHSRFGARSDQIIRTLLTQISPYCTYHMWPCPTGTSCLVLACCGGLLSIESSEVGHRFLASSVRCRTQGKSAVETA